MSMEGFRQLNIEVGMGSGVFPIWKWCSPGERYFGYLKLPSTTGKKVIGEGHASDEPLKSITNITYGDGP